MGTLALARRRSDKGGGILLLIAIVVAAVAVIGPFVIAGLTIFAELRARGYRSASRASQLVSSDEKAELNRWEMRISVIEQRAQAIENAGWARGLPRRADGWFDARNSDGRELNHQLEALAAERANVGASYEALRDQLTARMNSWLSARTGLIGARVALVVFVGIFTFSTVGRQDGHGTGLTLPLLMFGSGSDGADRMAANAVATMTAGLALWMAKSIAKRALS
jgi:hypothetical protein